MTMTPDEIKAEAEELAARLLTLANAAGGLGAASPSEGMTLWVVSNEDHDYDEVSDVVIWAPDRTWAETMARARFGPNQKLASVPVELGVSSAVVFEAIHHG